MIKLKINNKQHKYSGDGDLTLLKYLRNELNITSAKDGCSGQAVCGACTVEINGKAKLSCVTKMKNLQNAEVITMEGIPDTVREIIGKAFVEKGAVQCGFCTPGFIMRTKVLFQGNKNPTREEIKKAMKDTTVEFLKDAMLLILLFIGGVIGRRIGIDTGRVRMENEAITQGYGKMVVEDRRAVFKWVEKE